MFEVPISGFLTSESRVTVSLLYLSYVLVFSLFSALETELSVVSLSRRLFSCIRGKYCGKLTVFKNIQESRRGGKMLT